MIRHFTSHLMILVCYSDALVCKQSPSEHTEDLLRHASDVRGVGHDVELALLLCQHAEVEVLCEAIETAPN